MAREWSENASVHRVLKVHDSYQRGADVKKLQAALNHRAKARGLPTVTVDGEYGPETARAVRSVGWALGALKAG